MTEAPLQRGAFALLNAIIRVDLTTESFTMQRIRTIIGDTRDVFRTKWVASELSIPPWVIHVFLYLTALRTVAYGIELAFFVTDNPISPLMAYANLFGIEIWGVLMLLGLAVFLVGVFTKRSVIVTIGTLICSSVWFAFAVCMGLGWMHIGQGGRHFVAALATAGTWLAFFVVQLMTLRKNGVGND